MTDAVEAAREAERIARRALRSIEEAADLAGQEAKREARGRELLRLGYDAAREAVSSAVRARVAAEDAVPVHEWEGRKVFREEVRGNVWSKKTVREEGIVETVRSTSEFAENLSSYRRPSSGSVIVRALKKDGTAGLKFSEFDTRWGKPWQLIDAPASADTRPEGGDCLQAPFTSGAVPKADAQ